MKKRFDGYRRLAKGLFGCSSLWAGPGHFVYVKGTGVLLPFVEEYKRFRFEDIHAITMAPTTMYRWTAILYALGAAGSAALIFLPDYDPGGTIVMLILFLPVLAACLLCLIVTLARGPSCRCRIQTSVGSVVIRPLSRLRAARRAIDDMSGLVAAVQGADYPGSAPDDSVQEASPEPVAAAALPVAASRRIERSAFLAPTLLLLLVCGGLWVVHAGVMHWWPLTILGLLDLLLFLGVSVSLVQQMRGYTPGSILGVLWIAMAQQFVIMGAAFAVYIYWSVQTGVGSARSELISLPALYEQAQAAAVVYYFSMINGLASVVLGVAGGALVWRHRSRMRRGAAPPEMPPPLPGAPALTRAARTGLEGEETP